jgi:Zn-dependent protease with chaperone function
MAAALKASRVAEYEADAFAAHLGSGKALSAALTKVGWHKSADGLSAWRTHPDVTDRLRRLQEVGT